MKTWRTATLGDLFAPDNSRLGKHEVEPTVLSLSKYHGFVRAQDYFDKRIASDKLDQYKAVQPDGWAFSTIHIDEGSIARNTLGEVGVISPMYTTLRWTSATDLPEFVSLLVRLPRMLAEYGNRAQGSVNRRRSLSFKAFAEIPVSLPPPPVQRRIVDLASAFDHHASSLVAEAAAAQGLYRAYLGNLAVRYPSRPVEDVVAKAHAGGTPSRARADFYGGDIPWLKSGEVDDDHIRIASEFITPEGLQGSAAKLLPAGTTVVAMYGQGETKGRAGFLEAPVATNQAVLGLIPDPSKVHARYLLHAMRSQTDALRTRAVGAAQPNLSKGLVIEHLIPVPETIEEQAVVAEAADALSDVVTRLGAEARLLTGLKSNLVSALIDRECEVPEAYDRFIAGVA